MLRDRSKLTVRRSFLALADGLDREERRAGGAGLRGGASGREMAEARRERLGRLLGSLDMAFRKEVKDPGRERRGASSRSLSGASERAEDDPEEEELW